MSQNSKSTEVTLEQALEIGMAHAQANNLIAADRTFRDILESVPDHFDSLHHLAVISYMRGNMQAAMDAIEKAIAVNDEDEQCWNNYAIFLSEQGRYDDALKAWDKALAIKSDFPDPYSNRANTLWMTERYEEAEASCRKALELKPDYIDALLNLGNALASQSKVEEAIQQWQKAVEINPAYSDAWSNIGNAQRELGNLSEAEEACRKALEITPNHHHALNNLGNVIRDLGNPKEAEELFRQAIAIKPDFSEAQNNLAVTLIEQGRYQEAVTAARYATSFKPNYGPAYGNMSIALREIGEFGEAEVAAQKAVTLQPDSADAYMDLADVLFMSDRFDEAEAALKEADRLAPDNARIHIKMANILERISRVEEAMEEIKKAEELSPEMPIVYQNKAHLLFITNHPQEALIELDKVLEIQPKSVHAMSLQSEIYQALGDMDKAAKRAREALDLRKMPSLYMTLSKTKKFKDKDDPDLKGMLEIAENAAQMSLTQRSALYFALYKAFQDIGDHEKAFEYLKAGNDAKRATIPYSSGSQAGSYEQMKKIYTPEYLDKLSGKGYKSDIPVFILGMPRSGTTLTEQIISSHPDVYGAGELTDLSVVDYMFKGQPLESTLEERGKMYVDRIKALDPTGKAKRITDKMPGNYFKLGEIVSMLPDAKIIHCRRNPIDTCLSCYKQSFARGQYWSYNLEELGEQYKLYEDLMEHWRTVLPGRFLEIDYEETVSDLETQARKLIDYVGLEWNDACLEPHKQKRAVMTASKTQVIRPVYKTSVEAWRRYEKQLQPLVEILQPEEALANKK